jgi:hypothetical protein
MAELDCANATQHEWKIMDEGEHVSGNGQFRFRIFLTTL